jgi:hypothetical protein
MVISTISTYYTDATKSPLPCEGTTPGEGWLRGHPYHPSPCPLPPLRERARVRGNLISFPLPLILGEKLDLVNFG